MLKPGMQPRTKLYSTIFHPVMTVLLPMAAILTLASLIGDVFAPARPHGPLVAVLFAALVSELAIGRISYRERYGLAARIRELVFVGALTYLLFSLPLGRWFSGTIQPHPRNVYPTILVLAGWLIGAAIHSRLRAQDGFFRVLLGKTDNDLAETLRDHVEASRAARKGVVAIGTIALVQLVILSIATLVLWIVGIEISGASFFAYALFTFILIISQLALCTFLNDYDFLIDGVTVPFQLHRLRIGLGFLLAGVMAAVAIVVARDRSVLPFSLITAFFDWLGALFDRPPVDARLQPVVPQTQRPADVSMMEALEGLGEATPPPPWLVALATFMQRAGIVAAVVLVLFFLFKPLMSQALLRKIMAFPVLGVLIRTVQRIGLAIGMVFSAIVDAVRSLFDGGRESRTNARGAGTEWLKGLSRSRKSKKKEMEIAGVVGAFARLIQWGADHGVPIRNRDTASEFCSAVATRLFADSPVAAAPLADATSAHALPAHTASARATSAHAPGPGGTSAAGGAASRRADLAKIAALFEESVYSDHLIADERIQWYESTIREICATAAPVAAEQP